MTSLNTLQSLLIFAGKSDFFALIFNAEYAVTEMFRYLPKSNGYLLPPCEGYLPFSSLTVQQDI